MTERAAVLMMEGIEESETITIVDLLRRAGIETHTFCFQEDLVVSTMQGMKIRADRHYSEEIRDYDIIIIPGGRGSWTRFIENEDVMNTIRWFDEHNKLIACMCSGTKVVHASGAMKGKKVTGYTGYADVLTDAREFSEEVAVFDQNLITSQGPATPYPFAFKIMEALGKDPAPIKERMLYTFAKGK